MATAQDAISAVQEVQTVGDAILAELEQIDPAAIVPEAIAGTALDLLSQLVQKAIGAWSTASGVPITAASVQALLPNPTPLTPPTS